MPVARLAELDLDTFVAESAAPDALWLFLHIPKTAGTSLSAEFADHLAPYRNVFLSEAAYRRTDLAGDAFWAQLDGAIDAFLAEDAATRFRSVSGHMLAPQAQRIRVATRRTRIVTLVRDPVARVVSDWRYQRSPQHPAHAQFSARYPRLADYVDAAERNKMYAHLALVPGEPVEALVERVGKTFAFVGAVEFYALSVAVILRLAGVTGRARHHERAAAPDDTEAPDAGLAAAIAERNAADMAIFRHFHGLLAPHAATWTA